MGETLVTRSGMKLWLDEEGIRRLGLYEFLINPAERQKSLASAFWASRKGLKGEVWLGNAKASSLQCAFIIRYAKFSYFQHRKGR